MPKSIKLCMGVIIMLAHITESLLTGKDSGHFISTEKIILGIKIII